MEIEKPNIKIEENKIKRLDVSIGHNELDNELIKKQFIKKLDLNFKDVLEEQPSFLLTLQPLEFFDSLEKEYEKVKDFDFRKVNVEDIKKHIRTI